MHRVNDDRTALRIRLLGVPTAERHGAPVTVHGQKAWALLAYLLAASAPVPRDRLARLLFVDAADPHGALRWNLAEIRRRLDVDLDGDPVRVRLPAGCSVDVLDLAHGDAEDALDHPHLRDDYLAGLRVDASAEFEAWLDSERLHIRSLVHDVQREAALTLLARGEFSRAAAVARSAAEANPLDENAWALLVRCLRADGRPDDARRTAEAATRRLRRELGVTPSTLTPAAGTLGPESTLATGRTVVVAQLDAGRAAVRAGALDAGITALRSSVVAARALGDRDLLAHALTALADALIHGVRGRDQEGSALLHEAHPLATEVGDAALTARIRCELGYVDFLRGRYERSTTWLGHARDAARATPESAAAQGWIDAYDGSGRADVGDRERSRTLLRRAREAADSVGDTRLRAYATTAIGRDALLHDEPTEALTWLRDALASTRELDWAAFQPYPEAFVAEALRMLGRLDAAREAATHALTLGEQIDDPCWEATALRGLGRVTVDAGDLDGGLRLLRDVPVRCRRRADTYRWVEAWGLDGLAETAVRHGLDEASAWTTAARDLAARHGMHPLVARAERHARRMRGAEATDAEATDAHALRRTGSVDADRPRRPAGPRIPTRP